jgi:hypothetical protein
MAFILLRRSPALKAFRSAVDQAAIAEDQKFSQLVTCKDIIDFLNRRFSSSSA